MVQTKQAQSRQQRTEMAISHALAGQWDLAARENRALLDENEPDVETANRLGKALTELGDRPAAARAYEHALSIDPANAIARKNLARLSVKQAGPDRPPAQRASNGGASKRATTKNARKKTGGGGAAAATAAPQHTVRRQSLIEESAKSAQFPLHRPNAGALARVSAGDPATLQATAAGVAVVSQDGATLGWIDPAAAARLRRMMEGGNRYAAIVRRVGDGNGGGNGSSGDEATVYVREVYTDPSLAGQASFLTRRSTRRQPPRAYTKASIVQHEAAEPDEEEEVDGDASDARGAGATQNAEMEERGFTAASMDGEDEDGGSDDGDDEAYPFEPEDGDAEDGNAEEGTDR